MLAGNLASESIGVGRIISVAAPLIVSKTRYRDFSVTPLTSPLTYSDLRTFSINACVERPGSIMVTKGETYDDNKADEQCGR